MTPFARLFATAGLVQAADQIALAALPVTAVLVLHAGPGLVGALVAAQTAAWLVVSLPAGVLVDRSDKRVVLLAALTLSVIAMAAATLAAFAGSLAILALAAFLAAVGTVTFVLVQIGLVPQLVAPAEFPKANARIELSRALAATAAPFVVGFLAERLSPLAGYPLAASLALGSLALAYGLRPPASRIAAPERPPVTQAIAEGARFVLREPILGAIGLCAIFWNFAFVALLAIFVPFALQRLGTDVAGAGLAQGINGLGMIAGAAAAPFIFARVQPRTVLLFGPISSTIGALLMVLSPRIGGLPVAALAFGLIGFGPMLWLVMQTSVRQTVTPAHLIGRVTATIQVAIYGIRPIGALAGGLTAQVFGLDAAMMLVAAAFAISALVSVASPLARLTHMPTPSTAR
ncbi:MFS transporter [Phreatobacter aquaticus]|uniref:MFS transporter n=1 Tax=Phreatobacter aquaticus TaxID=2570229 RepID=A0A4D7QRF0_9HYPH|nr:MFS transporter [Phreatobacter aquaticus]QCK86662.1 MFS transporter [Phreatobacter aquaticus]